MGLSERLLYRETFRKTFHDTSVALMESLIELSIKVSWTSVTSYVHERFVLIKSHGSQMSVQ